MTYLTNQMSVLRIAVVLQAPTKWVCFEYRLRLQGGCRPPVVVARDEKGATRAFVLKVREPGESVHDVGPTALACELICSAIARDLGLTVPDYAIVEMPEAFVNGCPADTATVELLRGNTGPNFGSAFIEQATAYRKLSGSAQGLSLLAKFEDLIAFDSAVLNADRKRGANPNLLRVGDELILIDHSLALPDQQPDMLSQESIEEHCAAESLIRKRLEYVSLLGTWRQRITPQLSLLRSWIPPEWETDAGDLERIFQFLSNRPLRFTAITRMLSTVLS